MGRFLGAVEEGLEEVDKDMDGRAPEFWEGRE
jgi:hypothetical protein